MVNTMYSLKELLIVEKAVLWLKLEALQLEPHTNFFVRDTDWNIYNLYCMSPLFKKKEKRNMRGGGGGSGSDSPELELGAHLLAPIDAKPWLLVAFLSRQSLLVDGSWSWNFTYEITLTV